MKRRVRKIANFFAFNLLFFALYLNFIHKDKLNAPVQNGTAVNTAAFSGTVMVDNNTQSLQKSALNNTVTAAPVQKQEDGAPALRLSVN